MEAYLSLQPHFFMDWSTYVSDVREKLAKKGWTIDPEVSPDRNGVRIGSSRCARLMFVAQLHHIAASRAWVQQSVFPMVATVIRSHFRAFLPCEYSSIIGCSSSLPPRCNVRRIVRHC